MSLRTLEYKQAIMQVLEKSTQPMDVEKIRGACRIGNWQTALKHCLELRIDGKIRGTKTSKSWIFWSKLKQTEVKTIET